MLESLRWLACCLAAGCAFTAAAQAPFLYQGRLNASGQPASGTYDLRFGLANRPDPGSGVLLALTNSAVTVVEGAFSATLDFGMEAFDGSPRWLEIGVRTNGAETGFTVLSPRQPLLAVPYALQAHVAARAALATNLADGGASLTSLPAASLTGTVHPARLAGITAQQMDPVTDAAYRNPNTNAVRALIQTTSGPGRITPAEFGAKGDGLTDDTAALQEWIDAAQARNVIAELPPATAFYRITDALLVRRSGGLTMVGTGGQSHITGGPPYTRSRIHQVTPGKHGIVITNIVGTGTPTDNVYFQGFMLTSEHYSPDSYGLAFMGGIPDTDVNVVMNLAARNFGVGLFDGSGCNMSVISCSFSYCGDGIQINGPIVNSVLIQSTILTGNRSNGLHVVSAGNITFDTGDIVTWKTDMAHLVTIQSGLVCIRNMNGEQGSPVEAIRVWSPKGNANVILDAGGVMPVATASARTYSLSVSNARSVLVSGTQLNAMATDGFPIIEYNSPPATTSLRPFPQKVVVGANVQTNWIGNHLRTFIPRLDGSSPNLTPSYAGKFHAGLLSVFNNPGETDLYFSAYLSKFNQLPTPVQVPLLQYAKDRLSTMTVSNLTVTGAFKLQSGAAPASGSLVNYPGLLSRVDFENGLITGTSYEAWSAEAPAYADQAELDSPAEVAAADLLVKRLKAEGFWQQADAIYLFRGGTPDSVGVNLLGEENAIAWTNLPAASFGPEGVTGDGLGHGVSELDLGNAQHFQAASGSLLVYVGGPGAGPSVFAGARTAGSAAWIGYDAGIVASLNGGTVTNRSASALGPWVISRTSPSEGFLMGRTSTNTFSAATLGPPPSRLGVLCALSDTGVPEALSGANLRALWVGAGLGPDAARRLIRCFDDYAAALGIASP